MPDVVLTATPRPERGSGPAGRLRRDGRVPAVVYGLNEDPVSVTVPARDLSHVLAGGTNTLITLHLDGDEALALARQIQRHPTRGDVLHLDFVRVRRDVAVSAEVAVHLEGEATGVRDGGMLEQLVFHVPVEAKPQDIPTSITVDVSDLAIGDHLRVADLALPRGVTTALDDDTLIAQVAAPRVQEATTGAEGEGEPGTGTAASAESGEAASED